MMTPRMMSPQVKLSVTLTVEHRPLRQRTAYLLYRLRPRSVTETYSAPSRAPPGRASRATARRARLAVS